MTQNIKHRIVPVVTDVVVPGDAEVIKKAKEKSDTGMITDDGALNLQKRIDDIEDVIGQTEELSPSRAHAIRAEKAESKF